MTDPFPNALSAIRNAFDMKDLTSKLLELILNSQLFLSLLSPISTSPDSLDKLADTLVDLRNTKYHRWQT